MCGGGTCRVEEELGSQVSPLAPDQVPSRDRHTLPQLYRLGLNLTLPPPAFITSSTSCACHVPGTIKQFLLQIPQHYKVEQVQVHAKDVFSSFVAQVKA